MANAYLTTRIKLVLTGTEAQDLRNALAHVQDTSSLMAIGDALEGIGVRFTYGEKDRFEGSIYVKDPDERSVGNGR